MRIEVTQRIEVPRAQVLESLVDPEWYASVKTSPSIGAPEPLSLSLADGIVHTSVRWRYAGTLPPAASRLLDASRLTWVIELRMDVERCTGSLRVVPDHYEGLLACDATVAFDAVGDSTLERVSGRLSVKIPLFADAVEQAIATGFTDHLRAEADALERYAAQAAS